MEHFIAIFTWRDCEYCTYFSRKQDGACAFSDKEIDAAAKVDSHNAVVVCGLAVTKRREQPERPVHA